MKRVIEINVLLKILKEDKKEELRLADEKYKFNIENETAFLNDESEGVVITDEDYDTTYKPGRVLLEDISSWYENEDGDTHLICKDGTWYTTKENVEYFDNYFEVI